MYKIGNTVSQEESRRTVDEEVTCQDGEGEPAKLSFKVNFLYKSFSFVAEIKGSADQTFKAMNPLLYHEYWYRPFLCLGDFFVTSYNAQHKYKASIEHFYTTYLPNDAYSTKNLIQLAHQRDSWKDRQLSQDPFSSVTKLKTGWVRMNISAGTHTKKKLMLYYELGIMKYVSV